ncbi:GNAT family N-acetyltransferase [Phytohabitans rumicis]|uniref:N-acetyltransferase n=1 Tax=Phytohabitans rumicis TaxID=1076125 RepID=A0A6V8L0U7_9ACTN|nr:GNAT family N-acetyltransferase [Phytohabitans rumicis]GFJ90913.1 N-acetyltransferase [Phytohabitans rumicis]
MSLTASEARSRIVRADHRDVDDVAELIADAFQYLGIAVWLVPGRQDRRAVLRDHIRIYVEHALTYGEVHMSGDRSGVAVWFLRDGRPLPPPPDYDQRRARACGRWTERFQVLDQLITVNRPTRPHHRLAFLAVLPGRQGEGVGSALLRHHHAQLDSIGIAAYVEATNPPSRDLYARHGYRAEEWFAVPDGTPFWPMWREPGSG